MQYLVSFARKRQVYLVSFVNDKHIYLTIYRPFEGDLSVGTLIHRDGDPLNNIKSYSLKLSWEDRFSSYLCRTQNNFSIVPLSEKTGNVDVFDEVIDTEINANRESRYLEIQAEESMFKNDLLVRANEECNLRRVNGKLYSCTVVGHSDKNGTPYDFGQFVQIEDDFAGVHGKHLIKEVEFSTDLGKGSVTKLTCCPPDGYTTIPLEDPVIARKTITGELNKALGFPNTVYPFTYNPVPKPLKDKVE
jgi:prophage tail gpP-like protein